MDIIYRLREATAQDVLSALADPPSYSAVRGMLRLLEDKGYLTHTQDGPRYVYLPTARQAEASRSALKHLLETFFAGSRESAVAALLENAPISPSEYKRLSNLLKEAKEPGERK